LLARAVWINGLLLINFIMAIIVIAIVIIILFQLTSTELQARKLG